MEKTYSNNLIEHLTILSVEEMKEFEKFICSPFHNNRKDVIRYFKLLKKYYPGFDQKNFTKTEIYSMLFNNDVYRDDVMRRLNSNLFKILKEFLAYKTFRKDRYGFEKSLLDYYFSRDADRFFIKQTENIREFLEVNELRDPLYFLRQSDIEEMYRTFMMKSDPNYKKVSFNTQIEIQLKYILSSILRLYGFAEYEKYFHNKKYELKFKKEILKITAESEYLNSETVEIYCHLLNLYDGDSSDIDYRKLKKLIDKLSYKFEKSECFQFYIHLFNYLNINKLKTGRDYSREEFEIAKTMIGKGLLIQNGAVDPGWFRGIFSKAFNAGELNFAEEFIDKHRSLISGEERESVVNHAYATLAIHRKKYDEALKFLEKASYRHLNDKWSVKNMYLTIYYEQNEHDLFFYTVDSIRHLIKEAGLWSENIVIPIRNFLNISSKLFRYKLGEVEVSPDELKKQTLGTNVRGRSWLLEKIDELEKFKK